MSGGGVARKVSNGYVGVGGVARRFYKNRQLSDIYGDLLASSSGDTVEFDSKQWRVFKGTTQSTLITYQIGIEPSDPCAAVYSCAYNLSQNRLTTWMSNYMSSEAISFLYPSRAYWNGSTHVVTAAKVCPVSPDFVNPIADGDENIYPGATALTTAMCNYLNDFYNSGKLLSTEIWVGVVYIGSTNAVHRPYRMRIEDYNGRPIRFATDEIPITEKHYLLPFVTFLYKPATKQWGYWDEGTSKYVFYSV